jgi:hypothetical protein
MFSPEKKKTSQYLTDKSATALAVACLASVWHGVLQARGSSLPSRMQEQLGMVSSLALVRAAMVSSLTLERGARHGMGTRVDLGRL